MESKKLEKPRKNGTFSTVRGVMNPHEEDSGVFPTLKTGIQYLPVDSIQTSMQEYLASHAANSLRPLEKEEKRACLYSVRPLGSVIPMQA